MFIGVPVRMAFFFCLLDCPDDFSSTQDCVDSIVFLVDWMFRWQLLMNDRVDVIVKIF